MNKNILILIINYKYTQKNSACMESIKNQTYKDLIIHEIQEDISCTELKKILAENNADYVFFIRNYDYLSRDYFRTLIYFNEEKNADIIVGDYLEENTDGLYFPNRTFNQNELDLCGEEIKEYIEYQKRLDFLWYVIWGKLYKKDLIDRAIEHIEKNISLSDEYDFMKKYVYSLSKHIISHRNSFYTYKHKTVSSDDYFKQRYVHIDCPLFYDKIKEAIIDDNIKAVSFDIFDTLILRPFLYPTDIFILLEQYADKAIPSVDGIAFKELRVMAEKTLRDEKCKDGISEITLDEIYDRIGIITGLNKDIVDNIKDREKELEIQYCYTRKSGRELYELAVYLGKHIIFTSDMYLPGETVERILRKNGYDKGKLFLSCEYKKTKANKELFKTVLSELKYNPAQIVHIGDNYVADVENAAAVGIKAYHLPKAEELFNNWNVHIYTGSYFSSMFESQCGIVENYDAKELLGIRCLMAAAANKMFDYPFVFYDKESDFNGNPYNIGYFALGMHIYAVCRWLIDEIKKNKYKNIHFMARDAHVVKQAFDILKNSFNIDVNSYYTYMSRKSLVPLMLQSKIDFINLVNCFNGYNILPEVVFRVISPVIKEITEEEKNILCKKADIDLGQNIGKREKFIRFSKILAEELFDEKKAAEFKENFSNYFTPQFKGKSATFDMGYSARVETVLKSNFNYDITANYIHTTLDKAYQREIKKNVEVNCFYDFTPYISGIARELIMSEISGSCSGYSFKDDAAVPILEESEIEPGTYYALYHMHKGALDFIKDMESIFGIYNENIKIRNYYASIPFDYYLTYSKPLDRSIFSMTAFEDDMGLGNNISFDVFWNNMITRMPVDSMGRLNYNRYGSVRRYLLMIVCGDLGELKHRIGVKLRGNSFIYGITRSCYRMLRAVYRKLLGKQY